MVKKPKRTLAAVEAEMIKLRAKRVALREAALALAAERNALIAKDSALRKVTAMSAAEREALGIPDPDQGDNDGKI